MKLKEARIILRCENIGQLTVAGLIDLLNEENNFDLNKLKEEALDIVFNELNNSIYITELEKEIEELKAMKVEGEVFTTARNFAIKILERLLGKEEANNE